MKKLTTFFTQPVAIIDAFKLLSGSPRELQEMCYNVNAMQADPIRQSYVDD
jgi:hypothetical protein